MPTPIVLCADDYALSPGVSAGIRTLIELRRLTATSCMTSSPHWPAEGAHLRALASRADIGLHLTLTHLAPLGPMPRLAPGGRLPGLGRLALMAYARTLDRAEIRAEITRQIDAFQRVLDAPPTHIDGHLHVHQLPIVRDGVLEAIQRRLAGTAVCLRICDEPLAAIWQRGVAPLRASVISIMASGLRRRAVALGVPANPRFTGVNDFARTTPYRIIFQRFLREAQSGHLVMCHPGNADSGLAAADPVVERREDEFAYLASDALMSDLAAAGCALARFSDAVGQERLSVSD